MKTQINPKYESLLLCLQLFSKDLKDDKDPFFEKGLYNSIYKSIKSICSSRKYNNNVFNKVVQYSKIIDKHISNNKRFSKEILVWLLLNYLRDEMNDIQLRSRLAHIDCMFYLQKIEILYPNEFKSHNLMFRSILDEVGL